jgi:dihydrofolate reductase
MTQVVVAMSMSLDGIAGPESADAEGMAIFTAILGWQFPLRSWREQQGMEGGEDSVDSRAWAENFARFGPQVIGRTMFDYGYPNWGENPPFHAPVFVVTHRGGERIEKNGGTSYTFVTGGIKAAVEGARAVADAVNEYQTSPLFSDRERAALAFATELTEHKHVSPGTFESLASHYSEREICEITWLVSTNHLFNINNLGLGIGSDGLCEINRRPEHASPS